MFNMAACDTFSDIIFDSPKTATLEHCNLWGCTVSGTTVIYTGPWVSWYRGVCRTLSGSLRVRYENVCRHVDGSRGDVIIEVTDVYLGESDGARNPALSGSSHLKLFSFGSVFSMPWHGWSSDGSLGGGEVNDLALSCNVKVTVVHTGTIIPMSGTYFVLLGPFDEPGRQWINDVRVSMANWGDTEWCQGFYALSGFTGRYYLSSNTGVSVSGNHFYANGSQYNSTDELAQSVLCEVTSSFVYQHRHVWGGSAFDPFSRQQYPPDAGFKEHFLER